jgi:hypothetical protein
VSRTAQQTLIAALAGIDARLRKTPGAVDVRYDRARCLELLGRVDEAVSAYRDVLARSPAHLGSLNGLGTLLLGKKEIAAARALYEQVVELHPDDSSGHSNLAYTLLVDGNVAGARAHYETALRLDPQLALAHHGLAEVLEKLGDLEGAIRHRHLGIASRPITALRYRGEGPPIRLLLIGSSTGGNLVMAGHMDDRVFQTFALVAEYYTAGMPLPPHDLVFNAIGEADRCADALATAAAIVERSKVPVVNDPGAVSRTGRVANAARLGALDGVVAPATASFPHALMTTSGEALLAQAGFSYPCLLRAPGYHTGQHFVQVDRPGDVAVAVLALPDDEVLAIEYLDARGRDRKVRKYRVMFVDGIIYPLHLAISSQWKVHFFSAEMDDRPEHRAEDAAFLSDMEGTIGQPAVRALERIRDVLGLDYGGVDFGLDAAGNVLLFEANASMVVPLPGPEEQWAYRRPHVQRILEAVRTMLLRRAGRDPLQAPTALADR